MKCQYWLNCIHVPSKGLKTEVKKHKKISVNKNNTEKSNAERYWEMSQENNLLNFNFTIV